MHLRTSEINLARNRLWASRHQIAHNRRLVLQLMMDMEFLETRRLHYHRREMGLFGWTTMSSAWSISYDRCHLSRNSRLSRRSREHNTQLDLPQLAASLATVLAVMLNPCNSFHNFDTASRHLSLVENASIERTPRRLMRQTQPRTLQQRRAAPVPSLQVEASCRAILQVVSVLRVPAVWLVGSLVWAVKRAGATILTANLPAT